MQHPKGSEVGAASEPRIQPRASLHPHCSTHCECLCIPARPRGRGEPSFLSVPLFAIPAQARVAPGRTFLIQAAQGRHGTDETFTPNI